MSTATQPTTQRSGMPGLRGKNVLVTGGTSGIGQAIAVRFAEYGANVAINYLRAARGGGRHRGAGPRLRRARSSRRASATSSSAATSRSEDEVVRMVRRDRRAARRRSTCWSTTPASRSRARADELSSADFDKVLAVNLRGAFLCAREAIRHFLADGRRPGSIVNVSSVHQLIPKPDYLGYSVSKGGMQNLTRTLALEFAGRGIRVNGIGPGATITPINRAWIDDPVRRAGQGAHPDAPRRRRPTRWPASPASSPPTTRAYITGQTIFVDGGLTLFPTSASPGRRSRDAGGRRFGARRARDARPRGRGQAPARRSASSARGGCTTSAACSTRRVPVFPGRYFRQTLVTTAHHANGERRGRQPTSTGSPSRSSGTQQLGTHLDAL